MINNNNNNSNNNLIYSHPLAQLNEDNDDFNNNFTVKKKNSLTELDINDNNNNNNNSDKPKIPPRNKINKQQKHLQLIINEQKMTDECGNYCENEVNEKIKLINIDALNIPPQQIRWFYKEDQNASKWIIFNGLDSLNLEIEYLLNKQNKQNNKKIQVLNRLYEVNILERKCTPIYWEGQSYFVMRGTWFNDQWEPLDEDICERIELEHINKFKDFILNKVNNENELPLSSPSQVSFQMNTDNDISELSSASIKENKTLTKSSVNDPIYSITSKDQTCYWYTPDEVYIARNNNSKFMKVLSFGKQRIGVKIHRGYKVNAESSDNSGDITHLVFVIHGIAQKLYEKSIIKNCDDLRKGFESMRSRFYPDVKKDFRCEFIPVDWRSSLTLDDGIVETITPHTIKFIRNKLNSSALDIMYYTSPLFRFEIMNGLSAELNRLYSLFIEKNPYFKSRNYKVSVVAHSLGSVIFYDILTHNNSFITLSNTYGEDINQETKMFNHFSNNNFDLLEDYLKSKKRIQEIEEKLLEDNQNLTRLDFQPENLFCLGSPLAVFLALRGVRPSGSGSQDHILPKKVCKNLFNIFHPCDAVAYRLEPLVLKHYSSIMPIEVHRSSDSTSSKHLPYKEIPNKILNKTSDFELSTASSLSSASTVSFNFLKQQKKNNNNDLTNSIDSQDSSSDLQTFSNRISSLFSSTYSNLSTHDAVDIEKLKDLERRLDYQLPTSNFELISALTSHTSYWTSLDVALFIVSQLFSLEDENN